MVECHLAKVKVAGPNPVSRSTQKDSRKDGPFFILCGSGDGIAHSLAVASRVFNILVPEKIKEVILTNND